MNFSDLIMTLTNDIAEIESLEFMISQTRVPGSIKTVGQHQTNSCFSSAHTALGATGSASGRSQYYFSIRSHNVMRVIAVEDGESAALSIVVSRY